MRIVGPSICRFRCAGSAASGATSCRVRRWIAIACAALFGSVVLPIASIAGQHEKRPLNVSDSIETTRILYGFNYQNSVRLSPDGSRYLVVLYRGDLRRNGNWLEFFTGTLGSIEEASQGRVVARLFTKDHSLLHFLDAPFVWLSDNVRIAFIWNDGDTPGQVTTLDLSTGALNTLTHHASDVEHFDISPDGNHLAFTGLNGASDTRRSGANPQFAEMLRDGFVVPPAAFNVTPFLRGYPDNRALGYYSYQIFTSDRFDGWAPRKVDINGYTLPPFKPVISPDGRWALLAGPPASLQERWDRYTNEDIRRNLRIARSSPEEPQVIKQLWLIDIASGSARLLWDVPYSAAPSVLWSRDSHTVFLERTAVPVNDADPIGLDGAASVEIDIQSGRFTRLDTGGRAGTSRFRIIDGKWRALREGRVEQPRSRRAPVDIQLRENPNSPPALFAVDVARGRERLILDIAPEMRTDFRLGRVELIHWKDEMGRAWSGRLYFPVDFSQGGQFPLVILTAPKSATLPSQFSLRGSELTSCVLSIAQPLATRNIAALVMGQPDNGAEAANATPSEGPVVVSGYESAIAHLSASGWIDRANIGLIGYSRTGYYVQYALTHSRFPFAAAIAADNVSESYLQYVLTATAWGRSEFERVNGGVPVGKELRSWLDQAPGFNADRIRTPLRMEINSGGITSLLTQWELFSQLRYLKKPVEMYVIPEIEDGSHGLWMPNQQLASLSGAVEWMDFWLRGFEDLDPKKAEQYARWRKLRELQLANEEAMRSKTPRL